MNNLLVLDSSRGQMTDLLLFGETYGGSPTDAQLIPLLCCEVV